MSWVIVTHEPMEVDVPYLLGPFKTHEEAVSYARNNQLYLSRTTWTIAQLYVPLYIIRDWIIMEKREDYERVPADLAGRSGREA